MTAAVRYRTSINAVQRNEPHCRLSVSVSRIFRRDGYRELVDRRCRRCRCDRRSRDVAPRVVLRAPFLASLYDSFRIQAPRNEIEFLYILERSGNW